MEQSDNGRKISMEQNLTITPDPGATDQLRITSDALRDSNEHESDEAEKGLEKDNGGNDKSEEDALRDSNEHESDEAEEGFEKDNEANNGIEKNEGLKKDKNIEGPQKYEAIAGSEKNETSEGSVI